MITAEEYSKLLEKPTITDSDIADWNNIAVRAAQCGTHSFVIPCDPNQYKLAVDFLEERGYFIQSNVSTLGRMYITVAVCTV